MSVILGVNSDHPGASAALVVDGIPIMAVAEERLNRRKYYAHFPFLAVDACLRAAGLSLADVDVVATSRNPRANVKQKVLFAASRPKHWHNFLAMRRRRRHLASLKATLAERFEFDPSRLRFDQVNVEHHVAHIASAYFASGWEQAAGFSVDGSGDFVTCMFASCEGSNLRIRKRVYVPQSLGSVYTTVCQYIGFGEYGDEGKVMGLAAYGTDAYKDFFDDLVRVAPDGSIELNPTWFVPFGQNQGIQVNEDGSTCLEPHYSDAFVRRFGEPRRRDSPLIQRDHDLACGIQHVFEKRYLELLNILHSQVPCDRVAMAGGCALNSVANGMVFERTPFTRTWIQPAAGDEGLSLGAALYVAHAVRHEPRRYEMRSSYLGPEYSEADIRTVLESRGIAYCRLDTNTLVDRTTDAILAGNVVGWFQGRMEWGPRALGNRSILAHPGLPGMKDVLNERIKRREWFRPFAPSVLAERQSELFEQSDPSPFMLHVYKIRPEWRDRLVAVNHVDNTGRLQSVARDENPLYHRLISTFAVKSGIPVVLNTSFNENEPIVCQPSEAADCFLRTRMDVLAIGPFFCRKA